MSTLHRALRGLDVMGHPSKCFVGYPDMEQGNPLRD